MILLRLQNLPQFCYVDCSYPLAVTLTLRHAIPYSPDGWIHEQIPGCNDDCVGDLDASMLFVLKWEHGHRKMGVVADLVFDPCLDCQICHCSFYPEKWPHFDASIPDENNLC